MAIQITDFKLCENNCWYVGITIEHDGFHQAGGIAEFIDGEFYSEYEYGETLDFNGYDYVVKC
jgi:hypothetical protein